MRFRLFAGCCLAGLASWTQLAAADQPPVDFNNDIRPILSENCYQCHGPDKNKRKADLRLDERAGLFGKVDDHFTIVAGKPLESELFRRITADDDDVQMPPPQSGRRLTPAQIGLIERWIRQGAEWKGHWAYIRPARPETPAVSPKFAAFVKNDIDRFIAARLEAEDLAPAPAADRTTLLRRLSFDLIGLPPSAAEVAAFVADERPDAYERVVDRLLSSPHFGERMAMFWLDLVRFANTIGYHSDNNHDVDMYRDYVINAFNDNKPFDQFTVEQLAGDLLPAANVTTRVASGYNRLLMTTEEGGAQAREYMAKYAADRVRNASGVWLAGTLGCAECHDHKFDPFTTRDFYRFAAFFADVKENAVGRREPTAFYTPQEEAELTQLDGQLAAAQTMLDAQTPALDAAQAAWEQTLKNGNQEWVVLRPATAVSQNGATLAIREDGSLLAAGSNPPDDVYTLTFKPALKGVTAFRLEALPDETLPAKGPGRAGNGNFVLNEIQATFAGAPVEWSAATATHSQDQWPVAAAIDGKFETGWAILNQVGRENQAVFEVKGDLGDGTEQAATIVLHFRYGTQHTLGRFRVAATTAPRPVRAPGEAGLPKNIAELLALEPAQRTDQQRQTLAAHFRSVTPLLEPQRIEVARIKKRKMEIAAASRKMLITEAVAPREMRVLPRGNWLDDAGEVVAPGVPEFLGQAAGSGRATRLDLARWIVSPDNPLTARVFVNRLWKLAFGQGLVKSLDDFGSQGALPTHPQLLDWLAVDFVASGWNVKELLRRLVTSGAYRQSSIASEPLRLRDPYNRWLARQGRFRLDAEIVRDNALAVSGLLSPTIGGPSAKPYQPAGYWSYLNFPTREYQADHGEGLYRRGVYTYWCRTFLHPSLLAFDAPTREECTVERPRSNTPLQALVLLNDPIYVEAARVFAERLMREGGATVESKIAFGFQQALSRPPHAEETALLAALFEKHRAQYQADAAAAEKLIHTGERPVPGDLSAIELAAWTSVARVIFNLHEMITRM